ncbi:MAG TPA: DUF1579 family protein [Gemmatimonadales bacterium]|nr:DUF1579 family protein [Gemmatimonadales bacterium]
MRIAYRSLAAVTLLATSTLRAQAPPAPKPGPEHQKLDYFAGRWHEVAEVKPGPMGPGGKMAGTSTCEWFAGGFYLVCRSDGSGPAGEMRGLGIMGYSTERTHYTYYGIDNSGMGGDPAYGELRGDTWDWHGESLMGGKTVKGHYVIKQVSPDSYTWKWEISMGGGPWTVVAEGTDTRVK